jgi:hypothetical protein
MAVAVGGAGDELGDGGGLGVGVLAGEGDGLAVAVAVAVPVTSDGCPKVGADGTAVAVPVAAGVSSGRCRTPGSSWPWQLSANATEKSRKESADLIKPVRCT